jgi:4-amino-4-deoxy-L-arabinose transferase-like glycosyltransferase
VNASTQNPRQFFIDLVWLLALGIFVLAGTNLASFHGDEAMQITMSRDYKTAFIDGQPGALAVNPPYTIDSEPWLRLINGSVNRYTIGLSWHLAGLGESDLPSIWQWALSYGDNAARGSLPSDTLLYVARIPSALFLALSVAVMFAIGWNLKGRGLAYFVSGLYALNPIILLNGRRAMQEGSMLFFGLLAICIAIIISHDNRSWRWWIGLIVASALTLASKHSGVVFIAGAFGWVFVSEIATFGLRIRSRQVGPLLVSGILTMFLFIALSPALWSDPIGRVGDLLTEREKLLTSQIIAEPTAPTTIPQRIEGILTQPFIAAPVHYEASFWANAAPVTAQIQRYMNSPLSGLQFGFLIGIPLTILSGIGLLLTFRQRRLWGLLVWTLITVASLLVNPLPWQRYYLPLIPPMTILVGIGFLNVWRFVQKHLQPESPLVSSANVSHT